MANDEDYKPTLSRVATYSKRSKKNKRPAETGQDRAQADKPVETGHAEQRPQEKPAEWATVTVPSRTASRAAALKEAGPDMPVQRKPVSALAASGKPESVAAAQAKGTVPHPPGKIPVLPVVTIILAVFMAILDTSIVNVAIPKMMAVFGVNQTQISWVLTAYTLVVGSLVPVTGYLGERFGYKKVFIYALVIFTIGSGLCGAAWSNGSMILFRIIQAIGGGALMPVSMAMIFRMFPPERRGFAMGVFGIAVMFAPATGPTLSGYIVEYLDWRLIFYINVPIGIINFFLALAALKETETLSTKKFDVPGFVFSTLGFSTLLYALGEVADKGWNDTTVITFLSIAAVSLALFVVRELTVKEPMLELRLLKSYTFTISQLISTIATVILMGSLFIMPVFLQNVSGLSPIQTGLLLLPQAITSGIMMPIAGALFDRIGARPLAVTGMLITALSLYLNHYIDVSTPNATIIGWFMLRAVGIGLLMMPVQTAGMNTVPMQKVGQGTAITNTIRQVAASFGVAWLALLLSHRTTFHTAALSDEMNQFSPTVSSAVNQLQGTFAAMGQSTAQAHASTIRYLMGQIQLHAVVQAIDDIFYVTSILAIVGAVLSLLLSGTRAKKGGKKETVIME